MGRLTRISILSSFLYLSSFMWAYITERIFSQPSLFLSFSQETVGYLILFALAMASIGVFASAVALLIRPLLLAFGIEAFTALFLLMTFSPSILGVSFALSYFIALAVFTIMIEFEVRNYISFSLRHIVAPHLDFLFLILTVIISVLFFVHFRVLVETKGVEVPRTIIRPIAQTITESVVEKGGQREQIQFFKQMHDSGFLQQLGISLPTTLLDPASTVEDIAEGMTSGLANQATRIISPYIRYIPIITTTILFFALQEVKAIISWFTIPLLALLFRLLRMFHFVHYEYRMEKVKRLVLDS